MNSLRLKMQVNALKLPKNKKLCVNCLSSSHAKNNCKSKFSCKKCKKRHHTLLHLESKVGQAKEVSSNVSEVKLDESDGIFSIFRENSHSMLATAMVAVITPKRGKK